MPSITEQCKRRYDGSWPQYTRKVNVSPHTAGRKQKYRLRNHRERSLANGDFEVGDKVLANILLASFDERAGLLLSTQRRHGYKRRRGKEKKATAKPRNAN